MMELFRKYRDESQKLDKLISQSAGNGEKLYYHRKNDNWSEDIYTRNVLFAQVLSKISADILCDTLNSYASELERVKEVNGELVKALEFYADKKHYKERASYQQAVIGIDEGFIARSYLRGQYITTLLKSRIVPPPRQ